MDADKRPKRILGVVESAVSTDLFCHRIMGMYPGDRPGRGLSRRHNPIRFPIEDPGHKYLRATIGSAVVDAYLEAVERIDKRLA